MSPAYTDVTPDALDSLAGMGALLTFASIASGAYCLHSCRTYGVTVWHAAAWLAVTVSIIAALYVLTFATRER